MRKFRELAEEAFSGCPDRARLLGNLLAAEQYAQVLRIGLADGGRGPSPVLCRALDLLWDILEGRVRVEDFQDLANHLYAGVLYRHVGESLTPEQEDFYQEHLAGLVLSSVEEELLAWVSGLLMVQTELQGGRVEHSEYAGADRTGFVEIEDMLSLLSDYADAAADPAAFQASGASRASMERALVTPLFRQAAAGVQQALADARSAVPAQYGALREAYRRRSLLPEEDAVRLVRGGW